MRDHVTMNARRATTAFCLAALLVPAIALAESERGASEDATAMRRHLLDLQPIVGYGYSSVEKSIWELGLGVGHEWRFAERLSLTTGVYGATQRSRLVAVEDYGINLGLRRYVRERFDGWFLGLSTGARYQTRARGELGTDDGRAWGVVTIGGGYRWLWDSGFQLSAGLGVGYAVPFSDPGNGTLEAAPHLSLGWLF